MNGAPTAWDRVWRGLASTALSQVIAAGSAVALVPLFLRAWGVDGYGRWLLLAAAVSYLSLLELGGQSLFGNFLAYEHVRHDAEAFRRRLGEGLSVFSTIAVLAFAGLLIVVAVTPRMAPAMRLAPEEWTVIIALGANCLWSIPAGVYVTAYRATGLFVRGTMLGNVMGGIALIAYVSVLGARLPAAVFAVTMLAANVAGTAVIVTDIRRQIPAARGLTLGIAAAGAGVRHLGSSLHFSLLSIAAAVNQQAVILVLAASAGPAVVALYATHRTAAGLVGYVARIFEAPLRPELTFLHAGGREQDLRRAALLSVKVVTLLSGTLACVVWFSLPWVYPFWTGRHLNLVPALMGVLLLQTALAAGWSTAGWPLLASNQHHRLAYCALLNAGLTVALAVILAPRFGAFGVAVASLVGDVVFGALVYPWLAARSLGQAVGPGYRALLWPLGWSAAAIATFTILGVLFHDHGWLLVLGAALAVAGCTYGAIRTTFENDERTVLMTKLRQLGAQRIAGCWSVAR